MTQDNGTFILSRDALAWREHAACMGHAEYFFNDAKKTNVRQAKKICADCPVRLECLEHGMTHDEYGVWGGLTANERRVLKRNQRASLKS
jgi:WhiB family redox-sensing transcriptional regulator